MLSRDNCWRVLSVVGVLLLAWMVGCRPVPSTQASHITIGLVTNSANGLRNVQGFREGMTALGYVEGEQVSYIFEGEPTDEEHLDKTFGRLVEMQVDLIFTAGTPTGVSAHRVTQGTGIPVVFGVIADPIAAGVMDDLVRPGGNMTGVRLSDNQTRRLEFLLEIVPGTEYVFVPYDPGDSASTSAVAQIQEVADALGIVIVDAQATNDEEVTGVLSGIPAQVDAIFMVPGTTVNRRLVDLLAVAREHSLPVSAPSTLQVEQGALMTYGFIHREVGMQAAQIADQILKGADPATLPVQTAEFFLAMNLPAAEAIGLEIPYDTLQQAKLVIRD